MSLEELLDAGPERFAPAVVDVGVDERLERRELFVGRAERHALERRAILQSGAVGVGRDAVGRPTRHARSPPFRRDGEPAFRRDRVSVLATAGPVLVLVRTM